jgi:hypothetical protein
MQIVQVLKGNATSFNSGRTLDQSIGLPLRISRWSFLFNNLFDRHLALLYRKKGRFCFKCSWCKQMNEHVHEHKNVREYERDHRELEPKQQEHELHELHEYELHEDKHKQRPQKK